MLFHKTAKILVIVGALNWGLIGFFNYNLVTALLGSMVWLERLVYILVGLAGLWVAFSHSSYCMMCGETEMEMRGMKKMKK